MLSKTRILEQLDGYDLDELDEVNVSADVPRYKVIEMRLVEYRDFANELGVLKSKYTDRHPDVVSLTRQVELSRTELRRELERARSAAAADVRLATKTVESLEAKKASYIGCGG